MALTVYPNRAGGSSIFAGTQGDGIFLSTNNGANWIPINTGLMYRFIRTLAVYSSKTGGTNLFAGTDYGGIWRYPLE
jgi:hypothetical protein